MSVCHADYERCLEEDLKSSMHENVTYVCLCVTMTNYSQYILRLHILERMGETCLTIDLEVLVQDSHPRSLLKGMVLERGMRMCILGD